MTALAIVVAIFGAGAVATIVGAWRIARAYPPRGRFITVGGLRQHVLELGSSGGQRSPPIVLLHGAGTNLEDMHLALGERLAARHRVILIDRPGFGWSERKPREGSSPAYQATVLQETLEKLGVDKAVLVGHSWGGTLALAFTLAYPQRVAGLVLLAPPTHPGMRTLTTVNAALATPLGWLFAYTLAFPFGALLIAPGTRTAFLPQTMPRDYLQRTGTRLVLRPASLMANWADIGGLDKFLTQQIEHYGKLAVPTIAIVGDRDVIVPPPKHCGELASAVPHLKLTVLPGLGHMLHHAAAAEIVTAVDEFVERL